MRVCYPVGFKKIRRISWLDQKALLYSPSGIDASLYFNGFVQAERLGIPAELWRLVDSVIQGGALQTAEGAAELFPSMEVDMPSDIPLDDETAAVLR